jgi:hypothetical protein
MRRAGVSFSGDHGNPHVNDPSPLWKHWIPVPGADPQRSVQAQSRGPAQVLGHATQWPYFPEKGSLGVEASGIGGPPMSVTQTWSPEHVVCPHIAAAASAPFVRPDSASWLASTVIVPPQMLPVHALAQTGGFGGQPGQQPSPRAHVVSPQRTPPSAPGSLLVVAPSTLEAGPSPAAEAASSRDTPWSLGAAAHPPKTIARKRTTAVR